MLNLTPGRIAFRAFLIMDELEIYMERVVKRLKDPAKVFVEIMKSKKLRDYIIELNTEDQLYNKGIDSEGRRLFSEYAVAGSVYAPFTVIVKEAKGQPTNRMTLKDTGEFYRSFRVNTAPNGDIIIEANTAKPEGDLADRFGDNIIGLTVENLSKFIVLFEVELKKYFDNVIFS